MNSELLKVLILPTVLAGTVTLAVLTGRHGMPTLANWTLMAGWLLASLSLTLVARETQPWPLAGYLQNFVAFLGLCAVPFVLAYAVRSWLQAHGSGTGTQLGVALVLALLAILPAGLYGPFWFMFLKSGFGWKYISYP